MSKIEQLEMGNKGAFEYFEDSNKLAEMTYVFTGDDKFIIDHTEVDDSLRGKGVGRQLVEAAVNFAREKSLKILPLCPFAKSVFDKTPEFQDVRY